MDKKEFHGLVGPRSDQRQEFVEDEFVLDDGQPIWMSLIPEEETLVLRPEVVHEAKNRLLKLQQEHPEEIKLCNTKNINECRKILGQFDNLSQAA